MTTASTETARLLAKFESGALTRPATGAPSLVDLAQAWWSVCGVEDVSLTSTGRDLASRIGTARHLVCVIADGLGLDLLEAMPAASFLWQRLGASLLTVFPSTTAVALTSFYSAAWPAEHGITGHWLQAAGRAVTVLPFATRGGEPLANLGVGVEDLYLRPSLFPRAAAGRMATLLLPEPVVASGTSEYASGGLPRTGYRGLRAGVEAVLAAVEAGEASGRGTCTVFYTPRIDDAAHEHGPTHMEVVGAVRDLDAAVAHLAGALGARGRIVVTADHGHLTVPQPARRVLRGDDELGRTLAAPPGGDARVAYFHLRPDADREAFARGFLARYGEYFVLLTTDEVAALGLLGPALLDPELRGRIGDFTAISLGPDVLEFRPAGGRADRRLALRSQHSGLTAAEMRVPFVLI